MARAGGPNGPSPRVPRSGHYRDTMSRPQVAGPVLVAEDDAELLGTIRRALLADGLEPVGCRRVSDALAGLAYHRPAVAVIDVRMEAEAGWEVLRAARRPGLWTLVLDRLNDPLTRRAALAAGAHDIVAVPVDAEEMASRVRALLRRDRGEPSGGAILRHRDLVLDVLAHQARVRGRAIELTALQFAILRALCEARGATLHRAQLVARIASLEAQPPSERAVDLHVSRLRRRLGDSAAAPRYVESVYGVGYRLTSPDAARQLEPLETSDLLDALGEAVLVIDRELRIRSANLGACALLDRPRGEIVGRSCEELLGCRTPEGAPLRGPTCLGRAVLTGDGAIRHVRASVSHPRGAAAVILSHARIRGASDGLAAVEIRAAD